MNRPCTRSDGKRTARSLCEQSPCAGCLQCHNPSYSIGTECPVEVEYLCVAVRRSPHLSVCIEGTVLLPIQWARNLNEAVELVYFEPMPHAVSLARALNAALAHRYEQDGFGFVRMTPEAALRHVRRMTESVGRETAGNKRRVRAAL